MKVYTLLLVSLLATPCVGMAQVPNDELAHHHAFSDARFSDTSHYPAVTEYLKGSDDQPKPGEWMPQSGHAQIFYFPKEVAEIIGSARPGPFVSYLVAYFDHPETYSMHRLRSLILVSLSEKPLSTTVSWGSSDFQKEDMQCFFVPWYMATILERDFPKSNTKADWIAYFDTLHLFSISQP